MRADPSSQPDQAPLTNFRIGFAPQKRVSFAIFHGLRMIYYNSLFRLLKVMSRTSKEDSKISCNRRVENHGSREDILDVLEKKDAVRGLIHLALILDDQGFPKDAEDAYQNVIVKKGAISGQKDQVILFCQRKISSLLRQRGLYSEAEDQCKRVLELSIAATEPKSSLSLQAADDLAILWSDQGKIGSAFEKIRDVLDKETCSLIKIYYTFVWSAF